VALNTIRWLAKQSKQKENKMHGMKKFDDVSSELLQQSTAGIRDWVSTVDDTVKAYDGGNRLQTERGTERMTKTAMGQLFKMINLPVTVVNPFNDAPDIQKAMVAHKLEKTSKKKRGQQIVCRGTVKDEQAVFNSFLSEDYIPIGNAQILFALVEAMNERDVESYIHRAQINNRRMALRLVAPEWYHDLGNKDMAYTGLSIINDEVGRTKLIFKVACARVACFNWTMADHDVFGHEDRYLTQEQVLEGILGAVDSMNDIAGNVAESLSGMRGIGVPDVAEMIGAMSSELGIPTYATTAAVQWWKDAGATEDLFTVVQAMSFGVSAMTDRKGFAWDRREFAETQIVRMAESFQETGNLELCECPRCHRPMNVITPSDVIDADYRLV
jgi:hypothetical protein